jgi:hypothetical protein
MRKTPKILSLLLAMFLLASNVILSGHVSSHAMTDSGVCSICLHSGSNGNAITPEANVFCQIPTPQTFNQDCVAIVFSLPSSHHHQSRAPPIIA